MIRPSENITYQNGMSKQEGLKVFKAIGLPIALFALCIFSIQIIGGFGINLMCPLIAAMWITGVIVAILMPSMRRETLNQTMKFIAIYCLAILGLHVLLGLVSGVSSEMIAASYNQAIPTATGNAIPGYLQTMMWFAAVGIPIGQISMQVKRLFDFRKSQTLHKTFGQVRDMRNVNKGNRRSV